jgi:hypothetical protein
VSLAGDDRGQVFPAGSCRRLTALFCEMRALAIRILMHRLACSSVAQLTMSRGITAKNDDATDFA